MNYLLPEQGVMPMHCSANKGKDGDTALFFGLSGTGKTTLSADPDRSLIGDDEHGWSDNGIFNIEGGCYAKCIGLSQEKEPQIWNAIRFGSVLENVVLDSYRNPDYDDNTFTENTRAAYPVEHIPGAEIPGIGNHPGVIIFLTADAFGVLPPISKLTPEQAMYHFLSGYTSKLAGTERGDHSTGSHFLNLFRCSLPPPSGRRLCGDAGEQNRQTPSQSLFGQYRMVWRPLRCRKEDEAFLYPVDGSGCIGGLLGSRFLHPDPIFGLAIPDHCPEVPKEVLQPRSTWEDPHAYDLKAWELAERFRQNFQKFQDVSESIRQAGPKEKL